MVVLHGAGRVQNGEWRFSLCLKGVVGTSMVKIVTETGHKQTEDLQSPHVIRANLLQGSRTVETRVFLDVTQFRLSVNGYRRFEG